MIAEDYVNHLYLGTPCQRYWVHPRVMVGGSINDAADAQRLAKEFGITSVLNVETEHSDSNKGIPLLCETQVPDRGQPFPQVMVASALAFAKSTLKEPTTKILVHCQMGHSRSPAFAYLVLRGVFDMPADVALTALQVHRPNYGQHWYHQNYLASIEEFFAHGGS